MNPDSNLVNIADTNGVVQDLSATILNGSGYTGVIKYTGKQKGPVTVILGTAIAGSETVIDINNESCNLTVSAGILDMASSKYGISIKGGSCDNHITGTIRGRSKECEVFLDNWSDQSHRPSTGNVLNLKSENGSPIRIRYLLDKPLLVSGSGPYEFIFPGPNVPLPRWLVYKGFNELRRHSFTAKLFGLS